MPQKEREGKEHNRVERQRYDIDIENIASQVIGMNKNINSNMYRTSETCFLVKIIHQVLFY